MVSVANLNDRQRSYLLAIFTVDQKLEAEMRPCTASVCFAGLVAPAGASHAAGATGSCGALFW